MTDGFRIERALRQRTEALEEADWLKSQFIANVSYELRTPLNTIGGFSEILADQFFGKLNPKQVEYVDGILKSSGYLLALINDILDLATIEAGRMQLDTEEFDVNDMVQGVLRMVEDRALERRISLTTELPQDIGGMDGDERRIRQVIFNLLSKRDTFHITRRERKHRRRVPGWRRRALGLGLRPWCRRRRAGKSLFQVSPQR